MTIEPIPVDEEAKKFNELLRMYDLEILLTMLSAHRLPPEVLNELRPLPE